MATETIAAAGAVVRGGSGEPKQSFYGNVAVILAIFAVLYPFLPKQAQSFNSESVRFALSGAYFVIFLAAIFLRPSFFFPLIISLYPLNYLLIRSGGIYEAGYNIITFFLVIVAFFKLKSAPSRNSTIARGAPFIILFALEIFLYVVTSNYPFSGKVNKFLTIAVFIIILYYSIDKIDLRMLKNILFNYFVIALLVNLYILSMTNFSSLSTQRFGQPQGLNPNAIAFFTVMGLVCVSFFLKLENKKISLWSAAYIAAMIGFIFLTGSRMAMVNTAVFLFIFAALKLVSLRIIIITLLLGAFYQLAFGDVGSIINELASEYESSYASRRVFTFSIEKNLREELNEISKKIVKENPFFGIGPFSYVKYSASMGVLSRHYGGLVSHNNIFGTAAEYGLVGLALYLLWFISFLFSGPPGKKLNIYVAALALISFVFQYTHGMAFSMNTLTPLLLGLHFTRFYKEAGARPVFVSAAAPAQPEPPPLRRAGR